jgi:hypothetical protein
MRIRDVHFCRFCASFRENQAEFRTSKILLNIFADRALTTRIAGRSCNGVGALPVYLRISTSYRLTL